MVKQTRQGFWNSGAQFVLSLSVRTKRSPRRMCGSLENRCGQDRRLRGRYELENVNGSNQVCLSLIVENGSFISPKLRQVLPVRSDLLCPIAGSASPRRISQTSFARLRNALAHGRRTGTRSLSLKGFDGCAGLRPSAEVQTVCCCLRQRKKKSPFFFQIKTELLVEKEGCFGLLPEKEFSGQVLQRQ